MTTPLASARRLAPVIAGGFLMGAADIVPGVSGGTVALLLGIYERLVGNVRQGAKALGGLARGDIRGFPAALGAVEWPWLVALLSGIGTALVLLASTIEHHLEVNPIPTAGLFLGLVAGSVVVAAGDVRAWTPRILGLAAGSALLAFLLMGLRSAGVTDPSPGLFFGAGAIAICAMILPGISGSFMLLAMGMYEPVLDAAQAADLVAVGAFVAGAAIGLGSFSTVLTWALDRWHDLLLGALIGLMVGSCRVLWPWPAGEAGVGDTRLGAPTEHVALTAGLAVVGLVAVLAVARIARGRAGETLTGARPAEASDRPAADPA